MSLPEISVFLVDDHNLFRDGLKLLIDEAPDIRVVGTASSATEALRKADGLEIQVLMTDLSLPGKDGFWLVQELRKRFPRLSIHVLSMHSDPICVIKALEMGASGYLTKTADKSEILNAIRAAAKGESYLQPVVFSGGKISQSDWEVHKTTLRQYAIDKKADPDEHPAEH